MADVVNIPLNDQEQAMVTEAARAARLSVVQWIKVTILKAAKPPGPGQPPAPPASGA
jgi:hypothetical protein